MDEKSNFSYALIAIVAIVAIVGLVGFIGFSGQRAAQTTAAEAALAGQAGYYSAMLNPQGGGGSGGGTTGQLSFDTIYINPAPPNLTITGKQLCQNEGYTGCVIILGTSYEDYYDSINGTCRGKPQLYSESTYYADCDSILYWREYSCWSYDNVFAEPMRGDHYLTSQLSAVCYKKT